MAPAYLEVPASDFQPADFHNRVVRVEFTVCRFVRFLDALDVFDNVKRLDVAHVDGRSIPHKT